MSPDTSGRSRLTPSSSGSVHAESSLRVPPANGWNAPASITSAFAARHAANLPRPTQAPSMVGRSS
jgi:hypothetical protein